MSEILKIIKQHRSLVLFLGKALALYIIWQLLWYRYLSQHNAADRFIIQSLKSATLFILNLLGFDTFHEISSNHLGIIDSSGLVIGPPCDGLDLMYLYLAFFIAVPGKPKPKLVFSLLGIIVIYLFNVLRLVFLALIVKYNYNWFNFHHSYTFTLSMYVVIFLLWYMFLKKYAFAKN